MVLALGEVIDVLWRRVWADHLVWVARSGEVGWRHAMCMRMRLVWAARSGEVGWRHAMCMRMRADLQHAGLVLHRRGRAAQLDGNGVATR